MTAIPWSCIRLIHQSNAVFSGCFPGGGEVTFLWESRLMAATQVRKGHFRVAVDLTMKARLSKTFHMKISFVCIWMKTNIHNKNFALNLAFIMRFKAARKWPISITYHPTSSPGPSHFLLQERLQTSEFKIVCTVSCVTSQLKWSFRVFRMLF